MQNLSGGTRFKCYPGPFSSVSYKIPSNQVFKWADEEDDAPVMVWFDYDTEMLVTKRTWEYDIVEEETVCILGVKFIRYEEQAENTE